MKRYIHCLILIGLIFAFSGCTGYTDLMKYSGNGNVHLAELEIKNGADINKEGPNNQTPLYYAAANGNVDIIKLLLKNGADINYRPKFYTPLGRAIANGHFNVVKFMIENGANVNISASRYNEPAIMSIIHWQTKKFKYHYSDNKLRILKYLIDHGARLSDLNILDNAYYKEATASKNDLLR